jgi:hypothetical protein
MSAYPKLTFHFETTNRVVESNFADCVDLSTDGDCRGHLCRTAYAALAIGNGHEGSADHDRSSVSRSVVASGHRHVRRTNRSRKEATHDPRLLPHDRWPECDVAATGCPGDREMSNASHITEMVGMITSDRHFEAAQRALRSLGGTLASEPDPAGRTVRNTSEINTPFPGGRGASGRARRFREGGTPLAIGGAAGVSPSLRSAVFDWQDYS